MRISQMNPADLTTQSFGAPENFCDRRTDLCAHRRTLLSAFPMPGKSAAIEQLTTDNSGQTAMIDLEAPPVEYSLDPEAAQPYSEYTLTVSAPGYETVIINGTQILSGQDSVQPVRLLPLARAAADIVIPAHRLYGDYPPKIPEAEIKPTSESGEIVLSRVVVPETVVVHTGTSQ